MQSIARQTNRAQCDGAALHYAGHRPEQATLYRLMQLHAQTLETNGACLPQLVKDEFHALLEYSILAHGFLRLGCADCGHDKLCTLGQPDTFSSSWKVWHSALLNHNSQLTHCQA